MRNLDITHIALFSSVLLHIALLSFGDASYETKEDQPLRYEVSFVPSKQSRERAQLVQKSARALPAADAGASRAVAKEDRVTPAVERTEKVREKESQQTAGVEQDQGHHEAKGELVGTDARVVQAGGETAAGDGRYVEGRGPGPSARGYVVARRDGGERWERGGEGRRERLAEYLAAIKEMVEKNRDYPSFAKQLGLQGTVVVRASIRSNGFINSAEVFASSGHRSLDRSAVAAVRSAGPFKAASDFGLADITLDIPITYKLN
jgi:TonB family protein